MSEKEHEKPVRIAGEILMKVGDRYSNRVDTQQMPTQYLEFKGRMAVSLIERWGLVAGKPFGEDSAGRSQVVPMDPAEIVNRACNTAEQAIEEFKRRGWFHEVPERLLTGNAAGDDD